MYGLYEEKILVGNIFYLVLVINEIKVFLYFWFWFLILYVVKVLE